MNLNKNDKKILVLYALVGISFVVTLSYFDLILERPPAKDNVDGDISRTLIDKKIIEGNNTKNFELISNLEDYPIYLPKNILLIEKINQTSSNTIYNTEVQMMGIKEKFLIKHSTDFSKKEQKIEILDGDAKGTKIVQNFNEFGDQKSKTMIITTTDLKVKGILKFIAKVQPTTYERMMSSLIDDLIEFTKIYDSESAKSINELYVKILHRHADSQGLIYFTHLIENNLITLDEIEIELLNSNERKYVLETFEMKNISEIKEEDKEIINDLYREILFRDVDVQGLIYYGSLLEAGKITPDELRQMLLESEEKKNTLDKLQRKTAYELKEETRIIVNNLYKELLLRSVDLGGLEHFGSLLEEGKITPDELRQMLLESEEYNMLFSNPEHIANREAGK